VLVLDEPTFGQDANTWAELASFLSELLDAGTAVVSVTHDAEFSEVLGGTTLRLHAPEHRKPGGTPEIREPERREPGKVRAP
jgi:energy-coupling factor transport system ATP-binding protein